MKPFKRNHPNVSTNHDPTETLLRITETLGRVDARTASMEAQAADDRRENREAHKALSDRIDALGSRVTVIEDVHQDQRTTIRTIKILYAPAAGIAALAWPIVWPLVKAAL